MQTFPDGTIAVASATYSFLAVPKFLRGRFAVLLFRLASDVTRWLVPSGYVKIAIENDHL